MSDYIPASHRYPGPSGIPPALSSDPDLDEIEDAISQLEKFSATHSDAAPLSSPGRLLHEIDEAIHELEEAIHELEEI